MPPKPIHLTAHKPAQLTAHKPAHLIAHTSWHTNQHTSRLQAAHLIAHTSLHTNLHTSWHEQRTPKARTHISTGRGAFHSCTVARFPNPHVPRTQDTEQTTTTSSCAERQHLAVSTGSLPRIPHFSCTTYSQHIPHLPTTLRTFCNPMSTHDSSRTRTH